MTNQSSPMTCAVINPASANGSTGRDWPEIRRLLESRGIPCEPRLTSAPGQAMAVTRRALQEGFTRIVVVGGDGTINEVVNGFMAGDTAVNPAASLAIIARGTGSDFVRTLRIPRDLRQAVANIANGHERLIDLGRIRFRNHAGVEEVRYFDNIAEAGLGGAVVDRVNRTSKALGGFASFLAGTLATFSTYRNQPATITIDNQAPRELRVTNVVVANCRYFGGGMHILPDAVPDDGWLDVLLMKDFNRLELYGNVFKVYSGTHLTHPKVEALRAQRVQVDGPEPLLLDVDGEFPGTTPAEFKIAPQAIRVIVP